MLLGTMFHSKIRYKMRELIKRKNSNVRLFNVISRFLLTLVLLLVPISLLDFKYESKSKIRQLHVLEVLADDSSADRSARDSGVRSLTEEEKDEISKEMGSSSAGWGWWDWLSRLIGPFFRIGLAMWYLILWATYNIIYGLVAVAEYDLGMILNPDFITDLGGFTKSDFVREVAQMVAQLCNMVYLFILLYIATKTIFSSAFNYKSLLIKLVIAALLTNFSLVISGVIIDFSQIIMYSIFKKPELYDIGTDLLDNIGKALEVGSLRFQDVWDFIWGKTVSELISKIISMMGIIIFGLILMVTLWMYQALLIIRIVGLWILLILSPAAFLLGVLPKTEQYFKDWFEKLTSYAFLGPILVFFLWLAQEVAKKLDKKKDIFQNPPEEKQVFMSDDFYNLLVNNMQIIFKFLVLIIILWAGIKVADKFKIHLADNISGRWNSFLSSALRGSPFKGVRMGIRTIFNMRIKGRKRKLDTLRARGLAEDHPEIKKMESSLKRVKKWKDRTSRISAATSPGAWKRRLATYWKETDEEHWGDMDRAMKSFGSTSLWGDKKHKVNLAEIGMKRSTDTLKTLGIEQRVLGKLANSRNLTDQEKDRLEKIKDKIEETKENIAETLFEDGPKQDHIKDILGNEIGKITTGGLIPDSEYNVVQAAGENIDPNIISPKYIKPGENDLFKKLIKRTRYNTSKKLNKLETEENIRKKEKEIREKTKELDEKEIPDEELLERIEKLEGSDIDKTVWLRKLATSDKAIGKFINNLINKYGTLKNAMKELGDSFPEGELIRAVRAAESSAKKTNNPTAMGHTKYNSAKGASDFTNEAQREAALRKEFQSWPISKIGKLSPQMFTIKGTGDSTAIKAFAKRDWDRTNKDIDIKKFLNDANPATITALIEKRGLIEKKVDQSQKEAFNKFVDALEIKGGQPEQHERASWVEDSKLE